MSQAQGPSQSERDVPAGQVERQPEILGAEEEIRRVNIPRPRQYLKGWSGGGGGGADISD